MRRRSLAGRAASFILSRALAIAAANPADPQSSHVADTAGNFGSDPKIAQRALEKSKVERRSPANSPTA
jgi:hypothetical protein